MPIEKVSFSEVENSLPVIAYGSTKVGLKVNCHSTAELTCCDVWQIYKWPIGVGSPRELPSTRCVVNIEAIRYRGASSGVVIAPRKIIHCCGGPEGVQVRRVVGNHRNWSQGCGDIC